MKRARRNHLIKAILCIALIANAQFWLGGCGTSGIPLPEGTVRTSLPPDHPLVVALRGTAFEGPVALEINAAAKTFKVVFADDEKHFSGAFGVASGAPTITGLSFGTGEESGRIKVKLNTAKQITLITSSDGRRYNPLLSTAAKPQSSPNASAFDSYVSANADLLETAKQIDASGVLVSPSGKLSVPRTPIDDKSSSAAMEANPLTALVSLFTSIVIIWAYGFSANSTLLLILSILAVLQALMLTTSEVGIRVGVDVDPDGRVLFVAVSPTGEKLVGLGEKDPHGNPALVTGAMYIAPDGSGAIVDISPEGLLARVFVEDWQFAITNYSNNETIDVVIRLPDGAVSFVEAMHIGDDLHRKLQELGFGRRATEKVETLRAGRQADASDVTMKLREASDVASTFTCIAHLALIFGITKGSISASTSLAGALGCEAALLSAISSNDPEVEVVISIISGAACIIAPTPLTCIPFALDVIAEVRETGERTCSEHSFRSGATLWLSADPCRPEPGQDVSVTISIWPPRQLGQATLVRVRYFVTVSDGSEIECDPPAECVCDSPAGCILEAGLNGASRFTLRGAKAGVAYTVTTIWERSPGVELSATLVISTSLGAVEDDGLVEPPDGGGGIVVPCKGR